MVDAGPYSRERWDGESVFHFYESLLCLRMAVEGLLREAATLGLLSRTTGSELATAVGNLLSGQSLPSALLGGVRVEDLEWSKSACVRAMERKGWLKGLLDSVIGRLERASREGSLKLSRMWFLQTRLVPVDVLRCYSELEERRTALKPHISLLHPPGEAAPLDSHRHLGASMSPQTSWLLRLHPLALRRLHILAQATRRERGNPGHIPYHTLYPLYRAASGARLALLSRAVGRPSPPSPPLLASLLDARASILPIARAWMLFCRQSRRKAGAGGPLCFRRLDPVHGNSLEAIRVFECSILQSALEPAGRNLLASLYLALRLAAHQAFSMMTLYRGLRFFSQVFSSHSRPLKPQPLRRLAVDVALEEEKDGNVCLMFSWNPVDARALDRGLCRASGVRVKVSFVKRPQHAVKPEEDQWRPAFKPALRDAARTFRGIRRLARASSLQCLRDRLAGLDVAGVETVVPNWVYSLPLRAGRSLLQHGLGRRVVVSYHAGEDYETTISGLRRIYEAVDLVGLGRGDRLGHALALGLVEPRIWAYQLLVDALVDTVFEWSLYAEGKVDPPRSSLTSNLEAQARSLSRVIYGQALDPLTLWDAWRLLYTPEALLDHGLEPLASWAAKIVLQTRPASVEPPPAPLRAADPSVYRAVSLYLADRRTQMRAFKPARIAEAQPLTGTRDYRLRAEAIRDYLVGLIRKRGIGIEVCPTSNAITAWIPPAPHPLAALKDPPPLLVGTDDPAFMDTDTQIELFHLQASGASVHQHNSTQCITR